MLVNQGKLSKMAYGKEGWINCTIIIEILGKPADYIDKVIREVVEAIENKQGVEVVSKNFHEPVESKKLFSTFSEVEFRVNSLGKLVEIIFEYMPSNVEILSPNEIKMPLTETNEFINILAAKLHGYDALAKKLKVENMVLKNQLKEMGAYSKDDLPESLGSVKEDRSEALSGKVEGEKKN